MPAFWNGKKPKAQTLPPGLKDLVVTAFRAAVWVGQTTSQFQPGTKGISGDQISRYFDMSNWFVPCATGMTTQIIIVVKSIASLVFQVLPLLSVRDHQNLQQKMQLTISTSTFSNCPSNTLGSSSYLASCLESTICLRINR